MKGKLLLLIGLLAAAPASASLVLTLNPGTLAGAPGSPLIFQGTLTYNNTGNGSFIFLNDIHVTFSVPGNSYLTLDPNFFFAEVPGTLEDDGTPADSFYAGPIFKVGIDPATPFGSYSGTIQILGGFDTPDDADVLVTQSFEIVAAPEPGTLALTLVCLLAAGIGIRRKSHA